MNIFNLPPPGTTLQTITEEWKALSGFHTLMRQRVKLEVEHVLQLRQLQDSIDPTWSKSGAWALISPVIELWSTQVNILEECTKSCTGIFEACSTVPSPDESEKDILPSYKYNILHGSYQTYQDCQTAASSREAITDMQEWFEENRSGDWFNPIKPFPTTERNYRESVVAQRNTLRPIAKWHWKKIPKKLEAHVRYAEGTQTCFRDYLVEFSKSTSDLVKSISMAQKRLAEFSSLAFIHSSQECFEYESSHPEFQPAVYLNYGLGGAPAVPVVGVLSYLPKLMEVGDENGNVHTNLYMENILEAEKGSTDFDEVIQKLKERYGFDQSKITRLVLDAIGPLLPIDKDIVHQYKNGIKRGKIAQLLKPFPIKDCRIAGIMIVRTYSTILHSYSAALSVIGSWDARHLIEDIWRKWDFTNHRPLPRGVVRTPLEWNDRIKKLGGGELVIKKTGLPYEPSQ